VFDDTVNVAGETTAADHRSLRDAIAGESGFVKGVGYRDACSGTVKFCGVTNGIVNQPRATISMLSGGEADKSGPAPGILALQAVFGRSDRLFVADLPARVGGEFALVSQLIGANPPVFLWPKWSTGEEHHDTFNDHPELESL
jgi:hypothetical protein